MRQFPDATKFQRVIRRDFQHTFNPKPVKQSNLPFCAPRLILFQ
ncbi:ABC transporter permease, partial [Segatella copri]